MSLHLVAGIDLARQLPTARTPYFLLGLNSEGVWVVRDTAGRRAGLFKTREAAIKFARDESPEGDFMILHQPTAWSSRSSATSAMRPSHAPRYLRTIRNQRDHARWRLVEGTTDSLHRGWQRSLSR
jgi:hypothetical protein